jgi:hypothetical protein
MRDLFLRRRAVMNRADPARRTLNQLLLRDAADRETIQPR